VWQRAMLWRIALWSFLSRWILVGCAITCSWNEWGRDDRQEQDEEDRDRARRQLQEQLERNEEQHRQRQYQEQEQNQNQAQGDAGD
jgi:hypothetical protein